jgi:hypothetical protein
MFSRAAMMLLTLIFAFAGAQTAWAWSGSGTSADPYLITSTSDLNQLATNVNSGTEHEGDYFVLTTDLTYSHTTDWNDASSTENNFTPIGGYNNNYYRYFKGHFDGQGHTISGIRIYQSGSETEKRYAALFGQLSNGAEVKNVFLADARFTGYYYCGPIVGINYNGRVENCHVLSDVTVHAVTTNAYHHGGVVGNNLGTITGCTSAASITAAVSCKYNGGITGHGSGTVEDCIYFGSTVAGDSYVGAIIGYASSESTIRNCYYINDCIASAIGYTKTGATVTDVRLATSDDFAVSGDTYTIGTAAGWSVMCAALYHNDTYNRFSGKTVRLGDDITVSRMAGGAHHDFCGTFDGQGNTLTVNISSDDITDGSTQYVAPFRYVSNTKADPSDEADSPAAFRNLHVTGTITTDKQFTGGLIGGCWGTVSIDNCAVSTAITSTISGDGTHGGIVGIQQSGALTITGCVFDGSLLGATTYAVGGFIGYRKSGAEIRNSLFAPAEVTVLNTSGATFARNKVDTYNSYYTYYLCDGTNYAPYDPADADHPDKYNNGHATRTVTAGTDVTISAIALTGDATEYTVSGITAYSGGGLQLGETLYYGSGDAVSLTLSNTAIAPLGYQYSGYTTSAGTLSGTTLTMPDTDVTINIDTDHPRSTGEAVTVAYVDANGEGHNADAIALDGYETAIKEYGSYRVHLADGTYYVGHDISYDYKIVPDGDITLILGNGKTMTLASDHAGIDGGIRDLTIYGQSLDPATAGTLRYDGTWSLGIYVRDYIQHSGNVSLICSDYNGVNALEASTVTLNGGKLTITANSTNARAIKASMTVTGGQLDATATGTNAVGILASYGDITLGWTNADDRITASSYYGTVAVADGQSLYNGNEVLSGTITDMSKLDGKTLMGVDVLQDAATNDVAALATRLDGKQTNVALSGRTLYKDDDWNTLCLPFAVNSFAGTPLEGATVKELDATQSSLAGNTLTLKFKDATSIEAGKPYLVKWAAGTDIVNPVFQDVTINNAPTTVAFTGGSFVGTYSPVNITNENKNSILLLATGNRLGYSKGARTLGSCRAYFDTGATLAREFVVDFGEGETTALTLVNSEKRTVNSDIYDLQGRKLEGKPTQKGMYIVNGKKVVIK